MLEKIKGLLQSAIGAWVTGSVVGVLTFVAGLTWWPQVWAWLHSGGDPFEVAFLLTILMVWLWRVAPFRPLPIGVEPVTGPGAVAVLTVRNRGGSGTFYASMDVLAANGPTGTPANFRRVSLRPTWAGGMYGGGLSSRDIKRNQTGDLHLAWLKRDEPTDPRSEIVGLQLTDHDNPGPVFGSESQPCADIDLRVTITREETNSFLRILPIPRSFVGFFTVESRDGAVATLPTPRTVRKMTSGE